MARYQLRIISIKFIINRAKFKSALPHYAQPLTLDQPCPLVHCHYIPIRHGYRIASDPTFSNICEPSDETLSNSVKRNVNHFLHPLLQVLPPERAVNIIRCDSG